MLGEAKMKALDRSEFLQVLVRAAVMKYVLTAQVRLRILASHADSTLGSILGSILIPY